MKILIAGAGKVGASLTRELIADGNEITIIEEKKDVLEAECEQFDVMGMEGNCASMQVLKDAGIQDMDLLIAVTNADEINLLCCATAHKLNPQLHTIARVRDPEYIDQIYAMQDIFGLSLIINPERSAATEIDHLLRYPGFLKRESFAKGRVEVVEVQVDAASPLREVILKDVQKVTKCRCLVCAILRNGEAIMPSGDFVLKEGDHVFVTAPTHNMTTLLRNLGLMSQKVTQAMICGGGRISYYLAEQLERGGIRVQIIEQDAEKCEDLARKLPEATIIHGDVSSIEVLEKEGLSECDALVTLTGLDELNVMLSLYGKAKGIHHIITKHGHAEQMNGVVESLALGSLISPKDLTCSRILRYVRSLQDKGGNTAVTVQAIAHGKAKASEFIITADSQNQGIPLKDLKLRRGLLIAAISRGRNTEIPSGASTFEEGASVIVVSSGETPVLRFNDIFA